MMTNRNLKHSPRRVLMTREQRVTLQWRHVQRAVSTWKMWTVPGTGKQRPPAHGLRHWEGHGLCLIEKTAPTWIKGQQKTPGPFPSKRKEKYCFSWYCFLLKSSTMKHKQRLRNCSRLKNSKEIWKLTVTYDVGLSLPVCDRAGTAGETWIGSVLPAWCQY